MLETPRVAVGTVRNVAHNIYEVFQQLIEKAGSQADLARASGIDPRHISTTLGRLKNDPFHAAMDLKTVKALTKAFGLEPVWLVGSEELERLTGDTTVEMPADFTGPGRWRILAARYPVFRRESTLALEGGEIHERHLDAAADEIGFHKGDGPTEEGARGAIVRAFRDVQPYTREALGKPAQLSLDAARSATVLPKKKPRKK